MSVSEDDICPCSVSILQLSWRENKVELGSHPETTSQPKHAASIQRLVLENFEVNSRKTNLFFIS